MSNLPSRPARFAQILFVAAVYLTAGRLARLIAIAPGFAAPVWPAAGIALAAVLILGYRACAGIALGSFLVDVDAGWDASSTQAALVCLARAASIGAGAAIQSAAGAFLVRRFVAYPIAFHRDREIAAFLVLAGPVSSLVSATWGVTTLVGSHVVPASMFVHTWWTWWMGDAIGAVIFTPIVLTFFGEPRAAWRRRRITVALPLCAGCTLVAGLFVRESAVEAHQRSAEHSRRADYIVHAIERRVGEYVEIVKSAASFLEAGPARAGDPGASGSRQQFSTFTRGPLARHRGLRAIEWIPRVGEAARSRFEEAARRDGLANFTFKERGGASGQLVTAATRSEYAPVFFVEPVAGNERAVGFDLASVPDRNRALAQARDSGEIAVTPPLRLVQEPARELGVLMAVPVYAPQLPRATQQQRRETLQGFALGVLRGADVIQDALKGVDLEGLSVRVADEAVSGNEGSLYGDRKEFSPDAHGTHAAIVVADRKWRISVAPAGTSLASPGGPSGRAGAIGLLSLSLFSLLLLAVTGREARIAESAARSAAAAAVSKALSQTAAGLEPTLQTAAKRIAESVGDGCAIALLSPRSSAACYHPNPETQERLRRFVEAANRPDMPTNGDVGWPSASVLVVPLQARGEAIGCLTVVRDEPASPYTPDERLLAQDLAERAAFALQDEIRLGETQAAVMLRDDFLSIASHELRTPLTTLRLQLETLRALIFSSKITVADAGRKGDLAARQASRLGRMVEGLLDVTRLTSGRLDLELEEVDLLVLVNDTLDRFALETERAGCALSVRGVSVKGRWDRMRLEQVLSNLLANAIKYAPGAPIEVSVENSPGAHARLVVSDGGEGVAPEDRERIFGRFERATTSSGHRGGLGLGLFVSRQIVEAHGGSMRVESASGGGSSFVVTLPVAPT